MLMWKINKVQLKYRGLKISEYTMHMKPSLDNCTYPNFAMYEKSFFHYIKFMFYQQNFLYYYLFVKSSF